MIFKKTSQANVIDEIAKEIKKYLNQDANVLWLVSGGSNINIEVSILTELERTTNTENLSIIVMDERYGKYNHQNSNSAQLRSFGFIPKKAKFIDVLSGNLSFLETVKHYQTVMNELLVKNNYIIAQFGIGSDGHIAGIKPMSAAVDLKTKELIIGYKWSDFDRLTISARVFQIINQAYLVALSEDKKIALMRLKKAQETIDLLPALLLKKISNVKVYNSYIESE